MKKMDKPWSIYRLPVEAYDPLDKPEIRTDPVGKVFKIVFIFAFIQLLNLAATLAIWLR